MIKLIDTKINKKGEPCNYFYMNIDDYPSAVDNKIKAEDETSFIIDSYKKGKILVLMKNKKFKDCDVVYFPQTNTYGVSEKFKDIFENRIKAEFFKTTIDGYYLMVVNNVVDCVDKENTQITYIYPNRRCAYKRPAIIAFDEDIVENELLFSIPEEPLKTFCTEKFMKMCEEYNITNVIFRDFK